MTTRIYDEGDSFDPTVEPVQAPTTKSGLVSVYDQLRSELSKPATTSKSLTLKIPARPGIEVKFDTNLPLEKLDRWRTAAARKNRKGEIDVLYFNRIILVSQCVGIIFNGEEVRNEQGEALTFRSQDFIESLNALDHYGAVQALYDRDADILRAGSEVLEAAGYGDEDEDAEPGSDEADPLA